MYKSTIKERRYRFERERRDRWERLGKNERGG